GNRYRDKERRSLFSRFDLTLMKIILVAWIVYAVAYNLTLTLKAPRSKKTAPPSRDWGDQLCVLIIGATGGTGQQLVRQALEQGHEVTAFVRNPQRLKMEDQNLRIAQGDVLDYASVEAAIKGQNAVLCALGHKRLFGPTTILSRGT